MNLHCQMKSQRDINAILGNMIEKSSNKKSNYSGDIIVASTVSAMNVQHSCYGFSSAKCSLLKTKIYFLFLNKAPALEGKSSSELIASDLNAMHAVRKAFIEEESSEKLRKAIKAKTRNCTRLSTR